MDFYRQGQNIGMSSFKKFKIDVLQYYLRSKEPLNYLSDLSYAVLLLSFCQ